MVVGRCLAEVEAVGLMDAEAGGPVAAAGFGIGSQVGCGEIGGVGDGGGGEEVEAVGAFVVEGVPVGEIIVVGGVGAGEDFFEVGDAVVVRVVVAGVGVEAVMALDEVGNSVAVGIHVGGIVGEGVVGGDDVGESAVAEIDEGFEAGVLEQDGGGSGERGPARVLGAAVVDGASGNVADLGAIQLGADGAVVMAGGRAEAELREGLADGGVREAEGDVGEGLVDEAALSGGRGGVDGDGLGVAEAAGGVPVALAFDGSAIARFDPEGGGPGAGVETAEQAGVGIGEGRCVEEQDGGAAPGGLERGGVLGGLLFVVLAVEGVGDGAARHAAGIADEQVEVLADADGTGVGAVVLGRGKALPPEVAAGPVVGEAFVGAVGGAEDEQLGLAVGEDHADIGDGVGVLRLCRGNNFAAVECRFEEAVAAGGVEEKLGAVVAVEIGVGVCGVFGQTFQIEGGIEARVVGIADDEEGFAVCAEAVGEERIVVEIEEDAVGAGGQAFLQLAAEIVEGRPGTAVAESLEGVRVAVGREEGGVVEEVVEVGIVVGSGGQVDGGDGDRAGDFEGDAEGLAEGGIRRRIDGLDAVGGGVGEDEGVAVVAEDRAGGEAGEAAEAAVAGVVAEKDAPA